MKIEIIQSADNNLVAEFFSSSNTPETDANECWPASNLKLGDSSVVPADFARKLERERDDAREVAKEADAGHDMAIADLAKCERERDEAQKSASRPSLLKHFDLEELVHAAFRYYLGRRTISTCAFARNLAAAWPLLSQSTRVMIGRELAQAYAEAARNPDWQPLGADCDREAWDAVREAIQ